jgi:hypothetical protein
LLIAPTFASAGGHDEQPWLWKSSITVGCAASPANARRAGEPRRPKAVTARAIFLEAFMASPSYETDGVRAGQHPFARQEELLPEGLRSPMAAGLRAG